MPTTSYLGLTYPPLSNAPNVPQDLQTLASGVDTKLGGVILCTSSTRPTGREGAMIYETDTDRLAKYNGGVWEYVAGTRTSYTPTLTASTTNPTLGSGSTALGNYTYLPGPSISCNFLVRFGTSGVNAGSGTYSISLPVTAATFGGYFPAMGGALINDFSTPQSNVATLFIPAGSLSTVQIIVGTAGVSSSAPWVWAAQDYLTGSIVYPI